MRFEGFSGNQLKIIGLIAMTCDHIGFILFPECVILRIIGRIVFPIFAYMIAEGCFYTKNKLKYFGLIFAEGIAIQLVCYLSEKSLFQSIFITYSISILIIYAIMNYENKTDIISYILLFLSVFTAWFLSDFMKIFLVGTDYDIDYGFIGILIPPLIYMGKKKPLRLLFIALGLVIMSVQIGAVQLFSLASLPFLALYNGKRGKYRLKYIFYIYYPLHIALLNALSMVLGIT